MSSVSPIDHDETFPQDALTAQDRVDSAKLQTQVGDIKDKVNAVITALDNFTRDDDTLADEHVRLRMMHREVIAVLAASSDWKVKASVSVAATSNYATSGANNIDGITLTDDMRVLLTAQTDATENGIWVVNTGGAWTRATDADANGDLDLAFVSVTSGSVQLGSSWLCLTTGTVIDTTETEWTKVFAGQGLQAGSGLVAIGSTWQVDVDGVTIELDALGPVKVKAGGIGTAQLADSAVQTAKIGNNQVTLGKIEQAPGAAILGSLTGGNYLPLDPFTEVIGLLPTMVGDSGSGGVQGLAPAPPAGSAAANHFLHADGTYKATPGGSGVNIQAFKDPCRMATTGNIALTGTQTIDGVVGVVNDRVLVRAQTAAAENGIYTMQAGAWSRATDADSAIELVPGTIVHVNEGTLFARSVWRFGGSGTYIIGTTALTLKPLDLATLGAIEGSSVTVPTSLGLVSSGLTTSASGLLSAGTARLTVLPGGAGRYLLSVDFCRGDDAAYVLAALQIRKNGALHKDIFPFRWTFSYGSAYVNVITWSGIITLVDGDFIEFYGDLNANAGGSSSGGNSLVATMNRIGD